MRPQLRRFPVHSRCSHLTIVIPGCYGCDRRRPSVRPRATLTLSLPLQGGGNEREGVSVTELIQELPDFGGFRGTRLKFKETL